MPTLTYAIDDAHYAGRLTGRALIGRRLSHGVVLADPAAGRLHAWVDPTPDGTWAVTDAGGPGGTHVNGQRLGTARHDLHDGDAIAVGRTTITFHASDDLPRLAEPVVLTPPPGDRVHTSGVLFDCGTCTAPIWVGNNLVGKRGRCRHCGQAVVVPHPVAPRLATITPTDAVVEARPPAELRPAVGRRPQCGVCHAAVAAAESLTTCPECNTTYHAECWDENYGCSTYGCGQVNALDPSAPRAAPPPLDADVPADEPEPTTVDAADAPPMRWGMLTVLAAVLAAVVGLLLFGIPPAVAVVVCGVLIARRPAGTSATPLVVALLISVVGVAAGLAASDYWWLAGRHLPFHLA